MRRCSFETTRPSLQKQMFLVWKTRLQLIRRDKGICYHSPPPLCSNRTMPAPGLTRISLHAQTFQEMMPSLRFLSSSSCITVIIFFAPSFSFVLLSISQSDLLSLLSCFCKFIRVFTFFAQSLFYIFKLPLHSFSYTIPYFKSFYHLFYLNRPHFLFFLVYFPQLFPISLSLNLPFVLLCLLLIFLHTSYYIFTSHFAILYLLINLVLSISPPPRFIPSC